MKKRLFLGWFLLVGLLVPALGAESNVRVLSLQDCIQAALEHNLDLRIERYNPQLSLFDLKAVYAGYDPQFSIEGQHDYSKAGRSIFQGGLEAPGSESDTDSFRSSLGGLLPFGMRYSLQGSASDQYGQSFFLDTNLVVQARSFENSRASASINLTQPLLKDFWIDSTRLNIRLGKSRLEQSEYALRLQIMTVINEVEQAYYDLIYARESVKVQEKALELATRLLQENKRRVEVGAMAPLDEKQAEAQAASSRADLLQAQNALSLAENALKQLMSDDFATLASVGFVPSGTLNASRQLFSLHDSWTKGLTQRPDYLQAKLTVEQYGIRLKYDHNQLFPQLEVFGGYGLSGTGNEFSDAFGNVRDRTQPFHYYGGRLVIPLANTGARNRYRSTKALQEQTVLQLKKLEQDIMIQIDNAIKIAQSNFERVEATRAAREFAEAALDAEQKKLESGKSTSFFVLQLQRDVTSASSEEIRALTVYKKSLARLAFLEGSTLERNAVSVEAS